MISINLAYQHLDERLSLFYTCLHSLISKLGTKVEICVHEIGKESVLELPSRCKYLFTPYEGVYHRAWAFNRCVKELSTGDILILIDSDIIVTDDWINEALSCKTQSVAWGKLSLLNEKGTELYTRSGYIDRSTIEKTKSPSMGSAAGAVTLTPRDLFYSIKGIPEDFMGSWGAEDNALWTKLTRLGYKINKFKSEVFHLHHFPTTPRIGSIQRRVVTMFQWNKEQWNAHSDLIGNSWGGKCPGEYSAPPVSQISSSRGVKLTFAMLSWRRFDKLIYTLDYIADTLTIDANIVLMVQGSEDLDRSQRQLIRSLAGKFCSSDVFFTIGNIGTGPARSVLVKRTLNRFHTPYINLADDDTTYTPGTIEATIDFLDNDPSIGVIGIRYKPKVYVLDSFVRPTKLTPTYALTSVERVDCTGSATALIRREVFDLCSVDKTYKIGYWDLDFFLQARSVGWKIVNYKPAKGLRAINNFGGDDIYKKARLNMKEIRKSRIHFRKKWMLKGSV